METGAQGTAISPKVVNDLKLTPTGTILLTVASGETVSAFQYRARVDIPIGYTEDRPNPQTQTFSWVT